jgi:hypothetical protein
MALLENITFGFADGLRTSAGYKPNGVAIILEVVGRQDLAAIATTTEG